MLVYFEPAALCDHPRDLVLAPLPARKQLWEAGDEFVWKTESEKDFGLQAAFGLTATGELIQVDGSVGCSSDDVILRESLGVMASSSTTTSWEEWCSGMDGLGGLVMLAASLIV